MSPSPTLTPRSRRLHAKRTAVAAVAVLALAAGEAATAMPAAAAATAAPFSCSAAALSGSVLGTPSITPVTANAGQSACQDATGELSAISGQLGVPLPILAGAAAAQTTNAGQPGSAAQQATAVGGVANLDVQTLPSLPLTVPAADLSQYASVSVPLPAAVQSITGPLTLDLRPELTALLPSGQLPAADVLKVGQATAYAQARCVNGAPQLSGNSQVAGISVGGVALPTDQAATQALTLIGPTTVSPSSISAGSIPLPAIFATLPTFPVNLVAEVQSAITAALAALGGVTVPATVANVTVTPGAQTTSGGVLTQRALSVRITLLGQTLADLSIGQAQVGDASAACTQAAGAPPPSSPKAGGPATVSPTAPAAALACTSRRVTLIDVVADGDHVDLLGAAEQAFVGRTVNLVFAATGHVVAQATVAPDGSFGATAPLPARALRDGNSTRYQAVIGSERSLDLKLARRMVVTRLISAHGRVTIQGYVTAPLAFPFKKIVVTRRLTCTTSEVVAEVLPDAAGHFRVNIAAPVGVQSAVYRLSTEVRKTALSPRLFPTFTLPRAVDLVS